MDGVRLRELALRRELLTLRGAAQRELLGAQWRASIAPLTRIGAAADRSRSWLVPAAVAGLPLLWLLARRRRPVWRLARLALSAWPVIRLAHQFLKR